MTTNKRLKLTAREVAAHLGIAYVSARRQVLEIAERDGIPYFAAASQLMAAADAETSTSTEGDKR